MSKEDDKSKVKIKVTGKNNTKNKIQKENIESEVKADATELTEEPVKTETNNNEAILTIEESINKKKIIPEDVRSKIIKRVTRNLLIADALMIIVCILHLGFLNIERAEFIIDLKFFAFISLIVSIILFEKAYKKDNGEIAIYGIEVLVFSILILFLPYIYFYSNKVIHIIFVISPLYMGIYYCIKSIIIESRAKKLYYKTLSDVKEIVHKNTNKERKQK